MTATPSTEPDRRAVAVCDELETLFESGVYPRLVVTRPWSAHNPVISGEVAQPRSLRRYLLREVSALLAYGAVVRAEPGRPRLALTDPALLHQIDETNWDLRQKKLFLFPPERVELSCARLEHYTRSRAEDFGQYVLLTNYAMHQQAFVDKFPDCIRPAADAQMPTCHHTMTLPDGRTVTMSLVNIGVGPSNAKTFTDHIAVLRPDMLMMIGHCGGLRNHQELGDYVLARTFLRADAVLDPLLPRHVPVLTNHHINQALRSGLEQRGLTYRSGAVYTTADRNWELHLDSVLPEIEAVRAVAVDMESATVAANGFRYRIPSATLLCVSDKPLHGVPKLTDSARAMYHQTRAAHVDLAVDVVGRLASEFPGGIPNDDIRSSHEPLIGQGAETGD